MPSACKSNAIGCAGKEAGGRVGRVVEGGGGGSEALVEFMMDFNAARRGRIYGECVAKANAVGMGMLTCG